MLESDSKLNNVTNMNRLRNDLSHKLNRYEVYKNFYINTLIDYHYAKSNVSFHPTYKAFTFGIQYKYKFLNDLFQSNILKLYGKSFRIRFYPELFTTSAISNFHQDPGQLASADHKFKHYQFAIGVGLPIYCIP